MDPKVAAALISAVVSLFTFFLSFITKPLWESYFHVFKLRADHQYDQRKKIKEAISRNKVQLIDAAESLNHRLWNYSDNCKEGWHRWEIGQSLEGMYYLQSFAFRFLSFFAWCRKIENEMVYLDSTVSDKGDLEFIKYLKLFPQVFCDTDLFRGQDYDPYVSKDHFFKDDFRITVESMITEHGIMNFSEFKKKDNDSRFENIYSFIGSISNDQTCLKWYSMQLFHFMIMAFLTKYGYDFQKTKENKLASLAKKEPKNILLKNMLIILERNLLGKSNEVKAAIKALEKV